MPLGEAMFTQRAIRRFRPERILVADFELIMEAAAKAPNGGNRQLTRFLVVDDPAQIKKFGQI
jgi:nitroreductase